jgi:hypothetical protein
MKITKRKDLPKCVRRFKQLKGICVGGCVDKSEGIRQDHIAHAHSCTKKYKGWICLRYRYQLRERLTLLHEVAHLIVDSPKALPHGKEWKKTVVDIGGTFKSYRYIRNGGEYEYLDFTYRHNKG